MEAAEKVTVAGSPLAALPAATGKVYICKYIISDEFGMHSNFRGVLFCDARVHILVVHVFFDSRIVANLTADQTPYGMPLNRRLRGHFEFHRTR